MKRFLTLLLGLFFAVSLSAQTTAVLGENDHGASFKGDISDVVDASGESVVLKFDLQKKGSMQYYVIPVYLDSVSVGTTTQDETVPTYLSYSYDNVTYTNLDTVSFYGTDSDTTFTFSDVSTGVAYPFMKVTIAGNDSLEVGFDKAFGRFVDK